MRKIVKKLCFLLTIIIGGYMVSTNIVHADEPMASFTTTDGLLNDQGVDMQFWFDFTRTGYDRSTGKVTYKVTSRYYFSAHAWLSTDELYVNGSYVGSFSSHNGSVNAGYGSRSESFTVTLNEGDNKIKTTGIDGTGGNTAKTVHIPKFREYTVTFKDHDGTTLKTQTVQSNDNNYCATAPSDPTRTGYHFTEWNRGYCNFTSNITVTAQYDPNTYSVKYNGNGSTSGSVSNSSHTYDVAKKLNDNKYTKTGYQYTGWNTKADGSGTSYSDEQSVKNLTTKNGGTVTLYAKWDKAPSITAGDQSFYENEITSEQWENLRMKGVSASDQEDGNLSRKIKITSDNVNVTKSGIYHVTYEITDSVGQTVTKTVTITIKKNDPPFINAKDKIYYEKEYSQREWESQLRMEGVSASDTEDGNITNKIKVIYDDVEMDKVGKHKVIFEVTDTFGKKSEKTITVMIIYNNPPKITAESKIFYENEITLDEWKREVWKDVSAEDEEDGSLIDQIKIIKDDVDPTTPGAYEVIYEVTDSLGKTTQKEIDVTILENWEPVLQIFASSKRFIEGQYSDDEWQNEIRMIGVSAHDREDADLTDQIVIKSDSTIPSKHGHYEVTYKVADRWGKTAEKTVRVIVEPNKAPEIFAYDKYFDVTDPINAKELLKNVTAIDDRDGDISEDVEIIYTDVEEGKPGTYQVTFEVTDSLGKTAQKTINVYIDDKILIPPTPPLPVDKEALTIWNGRQLAQLSITKEMEKSLFEEGAYKHVVFGIYTAEDIVYHNKIVLTKGSLVGIGKVDGDRKINITLYHRGRYYLKELSTDERYQLETEIYYFEF